ncbi:MAG: hypothetical protein ACOCQD_00400 [archaeon]
MQRETVNLTEDSIRGNIQDKLVSRNQKPKRKKQNRNNRLQIFKKKVGDTYFYLVEEVDNLVVFRGRNWMMQKSFNSSLNSRPGWHDYYLSWFAIGTGGVESGDAQTIKSPDLTDVELYDHAPIGDGTDIISVDGKEYKKFDDNFYISDPEIRDDYNLDDSCEEEDPEEEENFPCDSFLITRADFRLGPNEGNGEDTQYISELGVFFSPSDDPGDASGWTDDNVQLYAKMCFSPKEKHDGIEIVFRWAALY